MTTPAEELVEPDATHTCPRCETSWTAEIDTCPYCQGADRTTPTPTYEQTEWVDRQASSFEELPAIKSAKRCGVQWAPWMGDWFTSWSPRNDNSNAEGTWDHWVDLAVRILQDPLTGIVRPEAQAAVRDLPVMDFYDESNRELTDDELALRYAPEGTTR